MYDLKTLCLVMYGFSQTFSFNTLFVICFCPFSIISCSNPLWCKRVCYVMFLLPNQNVMETSGYIQNKLFLLLSFLPSLLRNFTMEEVNSIMFLRVSFIGSSKFTPLIWSSLKSKKGTYHLWCQTCILQKF